MYIGHQGYIPFFTPVLQAICWIIKGGVSLLHSLSLPVNRLH